MNAGKSGGETMRFNDSEWLVMRQLWQAAPATVRDVLESLERETGWAYSTVKTVLQRLADKGAVEVEKRGNVSWFSPLVAEDKAQRTALRSLLDRVFGGNVGGLVQHLTDEERLSEADRRQLAEMAVSDPQGFDAVVEAVKKAL